jgi:beta-ribofuranosylaminobenzene 5'-phosphate synthase
MIVATAVAGNANADVNVARVTVTVPARLHLGFVDLHGGLGRRFGSLGIAIDTPRVRLSAGPADRFRVTGPDAARVQQHLESLSEHYGLDRRLELRVDESIPAHIGLGSGTQLALATGAATACLFGLELSARAVAGLLDRGARSSIGIATFEQGGVVMDGGRGDSDEAPPVLSRLPFPEEWRILLICDHARQGLHGPEEAAAFRRLPPFPAEQAAHLCRLVLMVALPGLAEGNLDRFGAGVAELQRAIGDYFKPVQGGRFASAMVAEVLAWLEAEGIGGVGQSSWGPTGFGLVGSESDAAALLAAAHRRWPLASGLSFAISRGRNRGADIEVLRAGR